MKTLHEVFHEDFVQPTCGNGYLCCYCSEPFEQFEIPLFLDKNLVSHGVCHKRALYSSHVTIIPSPATPENISVGSHLLYNDGRPGHTKSKATVLSVCKAGMTVQFEERADVTRILFSDYRWMKFLTVKTQN